MFLTNLTTHFNQFWLLHFPRTFPLKLHKTQSFQEMFYELISFLNGQVKKVVNENICQTARNQSLEFFTAVKRYVVFKTVFGPPSPRTSLLIRIFKKFFSLVPLHFCLLMCCLKARFLLLLVNTLDCLLLESGLRFQSIPVGYLT